MARRGWGIVKGEGLRYTLHTMKEIIIEEEISILTDTMVAFEEMTKPEDKAVERPKVVIMAFRNAFTRLLHINEQIVMSEIKMDFDKILKDYSEDRPIPPAIIRKYMDTKL